MATFVDTYQVRAKSNAGLYDATSGQGLGDLIEQIQRSAGYNPVYQVNDCDDADQLANNGWSESDSGTFDVDDTSADNRIATNALLLTGTAATDGTQYAECTYIDGSARPSKDATGIDWRDSNYIGWWMSAEGASEYDTAGELQFAIVNNTGGTNVVQTKHDVPAAVNAVHRMVEIDISDDDRDRVTSIRFYSNNSATGQAVEIDAMIRYKFGNGKGPAIGNIAILPIASGQTLSRGDICQLNVVGTTGPNVQIEGGADINTLGVVVTGGTGVANGSVYAAVQTSGFAYLEANAGTVAGEVGIWQSASLIEGGATGEDEDGFCKIWEAAGGQYDHILCSIGTSQTFIS